MLQRLWWCEQCDYAVSQKLSRSDEEMLLWPFGWRYSLRFIQREWTFQVILQIKWVEWGSGWCWHPEDENRRDSTWFSNNCARYVPMTCGATCGFSTCCVVTANVTERRPHDVIKFFADVCALYSRDLIWFRANKWLTISVNARPWTGYDGHQRHRGANHRDHRGPVSGWWSSKCRSLPWMITKESSKQISRCSIHCCISGIIASDELCHRNRYRNHWSGTHTDCVCCCCYRFICRVSLCDNFIFVVWFQCRLCRECVRVKRWPL